ncbi:DUF6188 family protein [Nocardia altamirensis]|uniref:DUF6188 family protein n=1 Tax=Nocardia altamirensis TaxID=472158 RepID=UPI00114CEA52|nr:DUF6188 family protein [Nocardia altamirensis]
MELQLKIVGQQISKVTSGFTVTMEIGPLAEFELQIEGELSFRTPAGAVLNALSGSYAEIGSGLEAIVGSTVTRADASEVDGLSLEFDSGAAIHVPVHPKYEAWGLAGVDGSRVICLPGGEFAIWSARKGK